MEYKIHVDGACPDNGKPSARGGWAYIVTDNNSKIIAREQYGKLRAGKQTNNRAELEAVLQALLWIETQDQDAFYTICSDSEMTVEGMHGMAVRQANRDIWAQIEEMCQKLVGRFTIEHVRGHLEDSSDQLCIMNCRADKLAKQAANSLLIAPVLACI